MWSIEVCLSNLSHSSEASVRSTSVDECYSCAWHVYERASALLSIQIYMREDGPLKMR